MSLPHKEGSSRQCCVFTPDESDVSSLTNHRRTRRKSCVIRPQPGGLHKPVVRIPGLLVETNGYGFENHLELCLLLPVPVLLQRSLPATQSDGHLEPPPGSEDPLQTRSGHTAKVRSCEIVRACLKGVACWRGGHQEVMAAGPSARWT